MQPRSPNNSRFNRAKALKDLNAMIEQVDLGAEPLTYEAMVDMLRDLAFLPKLPSGQNVRMSASQIRDKRLAAQLAGKLFELISVPNLKAQRHDLFALLRLLVPALGEGQDDQQITGALEVEIARQLSERCAAEDYDCNK